MNRSSSPTAGGAIGSGRRAGVVLAVAVLAVGLSGCNGRDTHSDSAAHPEQVAATSSATSTQAPPTPARRLTRTVRQASAEHRHKASRRAAPHHRRTHAARVFTPGVPASAMPDPSLTPGDVLTTKRSVVCVSGYSSRVRNVPSSEAEAVYARYRVAHVPYAHEVDHLVSLELGGSNAITNLWPEPYAGRWGAHTKDVLENRLHDLVCSGTLSLTHAQHIEATNWVAAYKQYGGAPPPGRAIHYAPRDTPKPNLSSPGSCEPGYSPCLPRLSDLDCAQIPASDKPVHVTGSDPYRLDADHNGWGCTSG